MSAEAEAILHTCSNCGALLDVSEQEPFAEVQCPTCNALMRVRVQFDHFEIFQEIASGGMGTVYKARDVNLDRIVALKLLRKEFSVDQDYIQKLGTEARLTASVNHPCVVKVFSFGCAGGIYYIAMELVDKGSLDDLMCLQGRIAEVQVLEIGIQIAQGLKAAYEVGLIHRDVKPGNILFADAHTAKVVDFGLAMPLQQAQDAGETEIWGTPYYVAPEKLNHEPEDFRSDIYSLGGTLFHAVAGRPPFEAENASMVALKHLKNQAVSLQAFAPDVSSPTSYVINRTLAKDPEDRYHSYDELIEHLEYARTQLLENSGKPRQPKARVVVEGEQQQEAMSFMLMGVIAFILVLAGILYYFWDSIMERRQSFGGREQQRIERIASNLEHSYLAARKQIIDGDPAGALAALKPLEAHPNITRPLKDWVQLHEVIAAFLSGQPGEAKRALESLRRGGIFSTQPEDSKLANFFPDIAQLATENAESRLSALAKYNTSAFEPLGLLVVGLSERNGRRFETATLFFKQFLASEPKGKWAWIASFKPIAQRYVDHPGQ